MAARSAWQDQRETLPRLTEVVTESPHPPEPQAQSDSSCTAPVTNGERGGERWYLHDQLSPHTLLHGAKLDMSDSGQNNLLALLCQQRLPSLEGALEWTRQEVRRVRGRLVETEAELLAARHQEPPLSAQAALAWSEVHTARSRLRDLQTMCEEEAAQNAQLQQHVQQLSERLERQGAQHAQDLNSMSDAVERTRVGVCQLEQNLGTECGQAALENIGGSLRVMAEAEESVFQENVTQAYDQSVATLGALRTGERLLLDQARCERQQLRQCCEVLGNHAASLRRQIHREQAECQMLEEAFHQQHSDSQHCLQVLEHRMQGLWRWLSEGQPGPVEEEDKEEEVTTLQAAVESRPASPLPECPGEDWPQQEATMERSAHSTERERGERRTERRGPNIGREGLHFVAWAADSLTARESAAEERQIPSGLVGMDDRALARGRCRSARPRAEDDRPQSDNRSLSDWSCPGSHSSTESDVGTYIQSSVRSLPPDSLPALDTPTSSCPQSMSPTSRPSSGAEGLTSGPGAVQLQRIRLLTGRMRRRIARSKYGLRFMSYPLITTDFQPRR